MHVIEWTIIESLSVPETNFFDVACSIQKVVKFKGRIHVQLPLCLLHSWQAALEAASRTVLRCMYVIEWTIIESLSVSETKLF